MRLLLAFIVLLLAFPYPAKCQVLGKWPQVVKDSSGREIVQISYNITEPIDISNANLTGNISRWLEITSTQQIDGVVAQGAGTIRVMFNSSIPAGETFFAYYVRFIGDESDSEETISLTTTLTFFTFENATIVTDSSEATICLRRDSRVVTVEEDRQWYIAIVLIVSLIIGILLALLVLFIIQQCSSSTLEKLGVGTAGKRDSEKGLTENSYLSANESDFSQVIASSNVTESSRRLELCEIHDVSSIEAQVQSRKANVLSTILEWETLDKNKKNDLDLDMKREIQKVMDKTSEESQAELKRITENNEQRLSTLRRNHEIEMETLKTQLSGLSPEAQDEILSIVNERHKLEIDEEEHISLLKITEAERKARTYHDIKCNILCEKLDDLFHHEDNKHPSAIKDGYALLLERSSQLMEQIGTQSHSTTAWRKNEDAKIRAYELGVRGKWNKYAQAMVDAVKTICRELQLESTFRKSVTTFVRDEMRKIKVSFDNEMAKERTDYLRMCAKQKSSFFSRTRTEFTSKRMENPILWVEDKIDKMRNDIANMTLSQRKYDIFAIELWNKKFQIILKATAHQMTTLKDDVVHKLVQNGASRRSVEEFITVETKNDTIEISKEMQPPTLDIQVSENKAKARGVILQSHHEVLKTFLESQPFPTEKSSEKLKVNLKNVQHIQHTRQSLQRIRDYIHFHIEMVKKKNKGIKPKSKKGIPKSEDAIRKRVEEHLERWRETGDSTSPTLSSESSVAEFKSDMLSLEENLSKVVSTELSNQMAKKSKLELLQLDLNALERLMMTLLRSLVLERKLSPAECNVVLQQHKNQTAELQKSSSLRTRRRLDQVVRKRLHSPPAKPFIKEDEQNDSASSQVLHHLNSTKNVAINAIRKIREDGEAGKEKFEILTQLNEQQASELRELDLKVIQALSKVAKVSSTEMKACLTLLLHHRNQTEIRTMVQVVFSGVKDEGKEKSDLLPNVREMISQQKHRLAENVLRMDEDFAPSPLRGTNRLQRLRQPHHVTFVDDASSLMQDRLSPLPGIRPDPVGRTSTPDFEKVIDYRPQKIPVYSNFDQSSKPTRRRKNKSLKSLSVAR